MSRQSPRNEEGRELLWFESLEDRIWLPPDEVGEEEARFVRRALRLRRGQSVLDAPCGAGRIAFHLAQSGCRVTGIDLRPQFVERARKRFRNAGLDGRFEASDLRELDFVDAFHGIYNWFGSFGYFSDSENADLLQRYSRALRRGGRLLVEQVNRERILRRFTEELRQGDIIRRNEWNKNSQRMISYQIIAETGSKNMSSMRLYTPGQLKDLFGKTGLTVEAVLGFPPGEPLRPSSQRMIIVGRKP